MIDFPFHKITQKRIKRSFADRGCSVHINGFDGYYVLYIEVHNSDETVILCSTSVYL